MKKNGFTLIEVVVTIFIAVIGRNKLHNIPKMEQPIIFPISITNSCFKSDLDSINPAVPVYNGSL